MREIDLDRFRTSRASRVYSGRDRGMHVREVLKVGELDDSGDEVRIRIPDDIFGLNQSFFLGMFAESVYRLGAEKFRQKYRFVGPEVALRTVEQGIAVCQHHGTAIDAATAR